MDKSVIRTDSHRTQINVLSYRDETLFAIHLKRRALVEIISAETQKEL